MKLKIDSKGAIYDTSVKEIHFYNYKILTPDISLENRKIIWWLADRLIANDNNFVLEIDLQDFNAYPEDFTFKIKFERIEVVRTYNLLHRLRCKHSVKSPVERGYF